MKLNDRLTGRRIGAAAVLAAVISCGGLAWAPAALAAPTVASATTLSTAHSATHSAAVRPRTAAACEGILQLRHYIVSTTRSTACHIAATGQPNEHTAVGLCTGILTATGVSLTIATAACLAGYF